MVVRTKRKKRTVARQESTQEEHRMLKCFDCDCVLPEDSFIRSSEGT